MDPVTQAVILVGGQGSRLSEKYNPKGCKPLIEHEGKTFLQYNIEHLKEAGFTDFLVVVNPHTEEDARKIVGKISPEAKYLQVSSKTVTEDIPFLIREWLFERFILVPGHHYLPMNHLLKMKTLARDKKCVITAYDNSEYPITKSGKMVLYKETGKIDQLQQLGTKETFYSLRNPYILTKSIAISIYNLEEKSFGKSIVANCTNDELGIAFADMPSEFDYDNELERTRSYIKEH